MEQSSNINPSQNPIYSLGPPTGGYKDPSPISMAVNLTFEKMFDQPEATSLNKKNITQYSNLQSGGPAAFHHAANKAVNIGKHRI